MNISIVIPVYNEKGRLETVLKKLKTFFEVIVVDDSSETPVKNYIEVSDYKNIQILTNSKNMGYIASIKRGIAHASGEIIVTMDGDGEHKPEDIPKLVKRIEENKCDIVFGKRPNIARPSERFLLIFARLITGEKVKDSGTGFRAIRTNFAKKLEFRGKCTCGMLLIESHEKNMRICEVPVNLPIINKPRKIAWEHFTQFLYILLTIFKIKI